MKLKNRQQEQSIKELKKETSELREEIYALKRSLNSESSFGSDIESNVKTAIDDVVKNSNNSFALGNAEYVSGNNKKAVEWYLKAARQGNILAKKRLNTLGEKY